MEREGAAVACDGKRQYKSDGRRVTEKVYTDGVGNNGTTLLVKD